MRFTIRDTNFECLSEVFGDVWIVRVKREPVLRRLCRRPSPAVNVIARPITAVLLSVYGINSLALNLARKASDRCFDRMLIRSLNSGSPSSSEVPALTRINRCAPKVPV